MRGSSGVKLGTVDVYYVSKMVDKFAAFSAKHKGAVDTFHINEQKRLEDAITQAESDEDKTLLEVTATRNEESRLEAQNAFNEMTNFVSTLKQAMGAEGGVAVCEDLTCGSHGYCAVDAAIGAKCFCKAGYQGDGFVCKPPSQFQPQALIKYASTQSLPQVADMHVSLLQDGHVGVAFRDMSDVHKGKVIVGKPNIDGMTWGEPVLISDGSGAFGPVLVALPETQAVAIAYRDEDRGGSAVLRSGKFDPHVPGELNEIFRNWLRLNPALGVCLSKISIKGYACRRCIY
jgi:hypothetical protein